VKCYAPNELEVSSQLRDEVEEEAIRRMLIRKQDLLTQLEDLEMADNSRFGVDMQLEIGPPTVELVYDEHHLKLAVAATERQIHAVIIFALGI